MFMPRTVKITVVEDISDEEYADLANALWMFMRNTKWNFHVMPDGKTKAQILNAAWEQYGQDAQWM